MGSPERFIGLGANVTASSAASRFAMRWTVAGFASANARGSARSLRSALRSHRHGVATVQLSCGAGSAGTFGNLGPLQGDGCPPAGGIMDSFQRASTSTPSTACTSARAETPEATMAGHWLTPSMFGTPVMFLSDGSTPARNENVLYLLRAMKVRNVGGSRIAECVVNPSHGKTLQKQTETREPAD